MIVSNSTEFTCVALNFLAHIMFSPRPTWFSCRIKQTSGICEKPNVMFRLNEPLSTMGLKVAAHSVWFPCTSLRKAPVGWQREIDCDINASHQGSLRRLMEAAFSAEEAKVKRLVPQWEQRMWEWRLATSLLGVSQTTKTRRRCLLTLLICHLPSFTQRFNSWMKASSVLSAWTLTEF